MLGRAWLVALGLACSAGAAAYPITVDGNVGDWLLSGSAALPLNVNTGHLARGVSGGDQIGEYTWRDAAGDQAAGVNDDIDIRSFHITATATALYFRIAMASLATNPSRYPMVQIAIDRTNSSGSGVRSFGRGCTDQTAAAGAWEYLVVTRFGSAGGAVHTPFVYDTGSVDRNDGSATAAMSTATNNIEIGVPWSLIGGAPSYRIHFTVISVESDRSDNARTTSAADAVTCYGHPASAGNTADETGDGVVDYRFDVWFHLDPEFDPTAPLVVSELLAEPGSGAASDEWVEIFNAGNDTLSLDGYRLGDEETVGETGEGMYRFPDGAQIGPGMAQVVAAAADSYFARYARNPRYEFAASDPVVPDMVRDSRWTSGPGIGLSSDDQVLLLDDHFTIIDAVVWGAAPQYPGVAPAAAATTGSSLVRTLVFRDTNSCAADFAYLTAPTPGIAAAPCSSGLGSDLPDGRACNNGDPCLSGSCSGGTCVDGARRTCAGDGNACTADVCDSILLGDCYPPRAAGAPCDDDDPFDCLAAQCDGAGQCDQGFDFEPAGTDCDGAAPTECHLAKCDGAGVCDPAQIAAPRGTDCADDDDDDCWTAACDGAGSCDQTFGFEPLGTPCADSDPFDCLAAQCDASGTCDQMHVPEPPGAPCQDLDPGDCITAACDTSGACDQSFGIAGSDVVCRPAAGACDQPERCDGASDTCPADLKLDSTQVCRPEVAGGCDVAEFCDGSSDQCPTDAKREADFVCRVAAGVCDLAEYCDGVGDVCPADLFAPETTTCDDGDACTEQTHCDGLGRCVPGILVCRAAPIESAAGCGCTGAGRGQAMLTLMVLSGLLARRRLPAARGRRRAR
ncbi:MAG: lamin tail domain-containing protein [Deltaproteobacteria bacterium]|nr:lamin tail domain-containing protein [Deltaproteobacteria bacterium]